METQNRQVPHPCVVFKNWEGYLGCGSLLWGVRSPKPTPGSPTQGSNAREKSPYNFWLWKPWDCDWDRGWLPTQAFLLKGPCMDLLADGLTLSELQHWGSSSKGARKIQRGNEFSGFRTRAGGETFSLSPSTFQCSYLIGCHIWVSINLTTFTHPSDSLRPCPTQILGPTKPHPLLFRTNYYLGSCYGLS